jgi:hypothetical protein
MFPHTKVGRKRLGAESWEESKRMWSRDNMQNLKAKSAVEDKESDNISQRSRPS